MNDLKAIRIVLTTMLVLMVVVAAYFGYREYQHYLAQKQASYVCQIEGLPNGC
jgi:hypothetical protein